MIRIGYLSAVRHASSYQAVFADDPRVDVVGVAEERGAADWMIEDSRRFAEMNGLPFFGEVESLLDPTVCDVLVVCSEPTRHADLAIAALNSGCHVLVDKPLAVSVAEADRIIEAEAYASGTAQVINRLESPAVRRLRHWIDAGHLGLPLHVDVEWFASGAHFASSVERPELVADPALSGGGELLNFLLYPVDYVRYLTGLEVVEVYAEASTLFQPTHAATGVEDTAVVSLLLENGVTASITLGRVATAPGHGPVSSSIRLLGSRGFATTDDDKPAISVRDTEGRERRLPFAGESSEAIVGAFLTRYIDGLTGGTGPEYRLADARAALKVTQASYSAISSGMPVRFSNNTKD